MRIMSKEEYGVGHRMLDHLVYKQERGERSEEDKLTKTGLGVSLKINPMEGSEIGNLYKKERVPREMNDEL